MGRLDLRKPARDDFKNSGLSAGAQMELYDYLDSLNVDEAIAQASAAKDVPRWEAELTHGMRS